MAGTIRIPYTTANIWSAKSHRSIGDFVGVNSHILRPILEGPRAQISDTKTPISTTPKVGAFCDFIRRRELPRRPYIHARIPRITGRRPNSLKLAIIMLVEQEFVKVERNISNRRSKYRTAGRTRHSPAPQP